MSERWTEIPGTKGKYKISNYGNVAKSDDFADGKPLKLLERRSANTFKFSFNGEETVFDINTMVSKLFGGLICEGTECCKLACATCGHNPDVYQARLEHIARDGLSVSEGGIRYLSLHNGV